MTPLAVLLMEKNKKRRKILKLLLFMGIAVSVYFFVCLLMFKVTPEISGYHIQYKDGFPEPLRLFVFVIYLVASITPLFVSTIKRAYMLGILMFLSCLVSIIFFTQYLTSVWCFFGALISMVIYWILRDARRKFFIERMV